MINSLKSKIKSAAKFEAKKPVAVWYTFVITLIALLQIAWLHGFISQAYEYDVTKISFLILFIFLWKTANCGILIHRKASGNTAVSSSDIDAGWFWSDVVLSLGMVGTVIGFMIMLSSFGEVNFEDVENSKQLISELSEGMSTALLTTLAGLTSSILIKIQFFSLETLCNREET